MEPLISTLLDEAPDLVDDFVSKYPDLLDELEASYDDKDWIKFKRQVHNLKGIGGGYGYAEVSETAELIESDMQGNRYDALPAQFALLRELQQRIVLGRQMKS